MFCNGQLIPNVKHYTLVVVPMTDFLAAMMLGSVKQKIDIYSPNGCIDTESEQGEISADTNGTKLNTNFVMAVVDF